MSIRILVQVQHLNFNNAGCSATKYRNTGRCPLRERKTRSFRAKMSSSLSSKGIYMIFTTLHSWGIDNVIFLHLEHT
jgi:hypothetical protein